MSQASLKINAPVVSPTTGELINFHPAGSLPGAIGRSIEDLSPEQILTFTKELTNKLAWAMGSFYGVSYSRKNSLVTQYAARCCRAILRDHGFPI